AYRSMDGVDAGTMITALGEKTSAVELAHLKSAPVVPVSDATIMVSSSAGLASKKVVPGTATFIGRTDELNMLLSLVDYLRETRALHMVTLDGEIGVGKSRLWDELCDVLHSQDDLMILSGGHRRGGAPMAALRSVLLEAFDPKRDPDEELRIFAEQLAVQHSSAPGGLGPFVTAFFDPEASMPDARLLDMEGVEALCHVLDHFLREMTRERIVLVGLDDMQWTDELTAYFIQYMCERAYLDQLPLGFVLMIRPGVLFGAPDVTQALLRIGHSVGERSFSLRLARLPPAELRALVCDMTVVDDAVLDALWDAGQGNPWFTEQLLSHAARSGTLTWSQERWVLGDAVFKVPPALLARTELALEPLIPSEPELEALFWAILQWIALLEGGATVAAVRTGLRRDPRKPKLSDFTPMLEGMIQMGLVAKVSHGREGGLQLMPPLLSPVVRAILAEDELGHEVQAFAEHLRML
ncbi:MAG: AAA family ATPase, partial [Myxococcota bacterium]